MEFLKRKNPKQLRHQQMLRIQQQMQGVKNEIEFVEILAQFWPLPNMAQKMERLEQKMTALNAQYEQAKALKVS